MGIILETVAFLVGHYQVFLVLPILIAFKAEVHYVSRVSIVSNTTAMFVAIAPHWDATRSWVTFMGYSVFHAYVLLGIPFGVFALVSYLASSENPSEFYDVSWWLFNSMFAGAVCLIVAVAF